MPEYCGQAPLQILFIEDNQGDVLLIREALREASLHFELTHLADGEQALEFLRQTEGQMNGLRPDLVLLDLNLPKWDGWEVFSEIRATPGLDHTPVVILSSSGNPEDRARAESMPASIYIRKPSTLDEFMAVGREIRRFCSGLLSA